MNSRAEPHILVIGDLMIDHYLWGSCNKISPEAPVQIIDIDTESETPGGAGNVVNNLTSLGAKVSILSVIGDDKNADRLIELLKKTGANTDTIIRQKQRKTAIKSRVIATHQQVIRYDSETRDPILPESEDKLLENLENTLDQYDILLLSDYAKGVLTPRVCQEIISVANRYHKKTLVDPKGKDYGKYQGAWLIKPNRKETRQATGIDPGDASQSALVSKVFVENYNIDNVLITLSENGMYLFSKEEKQHFPSDVQEVFDVTGAGDTVIAAVAYFLADNNSLVSAIEKANSAAAIVVGKLGSATASHQEIKQYRKLHGFNGPSSIAKKRILSQHELLSIVDKERANGKTLVFTNGCFDLLHAGHVSYLEQAASYGDIFVIGMNSDDSMRQLKGENRPIQPEMDRARILASLRPVDYVVIFDEETPYQLLERLQPDILIKGGDYHIEQIVGHEFAGKTLTIPFLEGRSTSEIIKRIQK